MTKAERVRSAISKALDLSMRHAPKPTTPDWAELTKQLSSALMLADQLAERPSEEE